MGETSAGRAVGGAPVRAAAAPAARRGTVAAVVPLRWRLLRDEPLAGSRNLALDHSLALTLAEGTGVLRLYGWSRPTVSFGRNEPAAGVYAREAGLARGIHFVRRPTGGGAVLHDGELTYAVVVPLRALAGPRTAYRRINECLAAGLRTMGADVRVSEGGPVRRPGAGPCFQAAAPGEVVARGRKLVGSAQARIGAALLQHGSIVLRANPSGFDGLARPSAGGATAVPHAPSVPPALGATPVPPATVEPPVAGLNDLVGDVSIDEVARAVAMSVRLRFGGTWQPGEYTARELGEAERLESEIYGRESWTWRR